MSMESMLEGMKLEEAYLKGLNDAVIHGHFKQSSNLEKAFGLWLCSVCGKGAVCDEETEDHFYCYNCGAKLDGTK